MESLRSVSCLAVWAGILLSPSSVQVRGPVRQAPAPCPLRADGLLANLRRMLPVDASGGALALADLDGDGDPEAFLAAGTSRLLLNLGDGVFVETQGRVPSFTVNPTGLAVGDVDGDLDLDVVLGTDGNTRLLLNDGAGSFSDATAQLPADWQYTGAVALGDVDGDDDLDLYVGNQDPGCPGCSAQDRLYLNDGLGSFTDATAGRLPVDEDLTYSVVMGDVDGDDDLDVVVGNLYTVPDRLVRNDGNGVFVSEDLPFDAERTRDLLLFDADGDGDLDLYLANDDQDRLYENDGLGVFSDETATWLPVWADFDTYAVAALDLEDDGDLDLVLGASGPLGGDQNRLLENQGSHFAELPLPPVFDATTSLACADLDGDGDTDVLVANDQQQDRLLLNDGHGVLTHDLDGHLPADAAESLAVAALDLDGDGDPDVVVGNAGTLSSHRRNLLLLNDGTGGFREAPAGRLAVDADRTLAVALGDVDGDQQPDVVFGNDGQNRLHVNDGSAAFSDETALRLPIGDAQTAALVLADLDGDGDRDLVYGQTGPSSAERQNRLCRNDGAGFFTDDTSGNLPAALDQTRSLALGDLDGDGDPDLVVGNLGSDVLLRNEGDAHFGDVTATHWPTAVVSATYSLALGDVDADGDLDAFLGTSTVNRLHRNDGQGSFDDVTATQLPHLAVEGDSCAAAFGDLDEDGDLDLLVGNAGFVTRRQNRLLRNDGHGFFRDATGAELPAERSDTRALLVCDLDDDGDLDAFVAGDEQQNEILFNRLRQLARVGVPRVGQPLRLELAGPPCAAWTLSVREGLVPPPIPVAAGTLDREGRLSLVYGIPDAPLLVGVGLLWELRFGNGTANREWTVLTGF